MAEEVGLQPPQLATLRHLEKVARSALQRNDAAPSCLYVEIEESEILPDPLRATADLLQMAELNAAYSA